MNQEEVQSLGAHTTNSARNANEVVSISAALQFYIKKIVDDTSGTVLLDEHMLVKVRFLDLKFTLSEVHHNCQGQNEVPFSTSVAHVHQSYGRYCLNFIVIWPIL